MSVPGAPHGTVVSSGVGAPVAIGPLGTVVIGGTVMVESGAVVDPAIPG